MTYEATAYPAVVDDSGYLVDSEEGSQLYSLRPGLLDYFIALYIILLLATNYSHLHSLLSNLGFLVVILVAFSMFFNRYHFQREFYLLVGMYVWVLLGVWLAKYQLMAWLSGLFFLKAQGLMMIVALRCRGFRLMRFYLIVLVIGASFLVLPNIRSGSMVGGRLYGTVGEANALGSFSAALMVAGGCLLLMIRRHWKWFLLGPVLAMAAYTLVFSASRGSLVTVAFFAAAVSWSAWRQGKLAMKVFVPLLILALLPVVLFFLSGTVLGERMMGLPAALGFDVGVASDAGTDTARLELLKEAVRVFKEHPIFGAGYGTFRMYSFAVYTHTTFGDLLYATGLGGFLLYYLAILSGWLTLARARRLVTDPELRRGLTLCLCLIVAQLAAGVSLPSHEAKAQSVLMGIWLGMVWSVREGLIDPQYDENHDYSSCEDE